MMHYGLYTLFYKEVLRFFKVLLQTLLAPIVTALLYLVVFGQALAGRADAFPGVGYVEFLIPGLIMMSVIQNAFANSSSSLIQSKVAGNLVFILLAPLSHLEFFAAFVAAAVLRGVLVGAGVYLATLPFVDLPLAHPGWLIAFTVVGAGVPAVLGVIAGVWAVKFDQLAGFQNFIVVPLSFLSGVFYSIQALPEFWRALSHLNPFFYAVDGFRYGFFGVGDTDPLLSLGILGAFLLVLSALTLFMLRTGYRLRD
ncbi:MAG TPA: ABC transporter permease [Burkholderiales bacterium]